MVRRHHRRHGGYADVDGAFVGCDHLVREKKSQRNNIDHRANFCIVFLGYSLVIFRYLEINVKNVF